MTSDLARDHFARVRPLLGRGLSDVTVGVDDLSLAGPVIELLTGCMLRRVVVTEPQPAAVAALRAHLAWKQPFEPLQVRRRGRCDATVRARRAGNGEGASLRWDASRREVLLTADPTDRFGWMEVAVAAARGVRDGLLGRIPWPSGVTHHGHPAWPFTALSTPVPVLPTSPRSLRGKHLMVIGCGSLGSEAVRALHGLGARWTLVDDGNVTVFNLARQWFGADEVGRPKVAALATRLQPDSVETWTAKVEAALLPELEARLDADRPDIVMLATGTHHHGMLGELLWKRRIPHVAACCYPQARYFEVSVVSPGDDTACLHCFRGHLYRGAPASTPLSDEVAQFLYRPMDDAARERAYVDLVAEPATRIETVRAAELLARCTFELASRERSLWFRRMITERTTCLLGGNVVERREDGTFAHGIRAPGQVLRLGLEDLVGDVATTRCDVCGRELHLTVPDAPPDAGSDADSVFL